MDCSECGDASFPEENGHTAPTQQEIQWGKAEEPRQCQSLTSGPCTAGGSRSKAASVLARLHALAEAEAELAAHAGALQHAEAELQARSRAAEQHRRRAPARLPSCPEVG